MKKYPKNIIIPMAGLSSRFTKSGYTLPKYMLYAGNKSLFRLAVESLLRINKNKVRFTSVIKKASTDCQDLLCFLDDVTTNDSEMQSLLTIIKQHIESIMIDLKNGSSWEV